MISSNDKSGYRTTTNMNTLDTHIVYMLLIFNLNNYFVSGSAINYTIEDEVTEQPSNEIYRRQMCPDIPLDEDIKQYGLIPDQNKCFKFSNFEQGPCPKNMVFLQESEGALKGICDCKYEETNRLYVYHKDTDQCYPIFDQAYCRTGQWLFFNQTSRETICEENPCLSHQISKSNETEQIVIVPFMGECFEMLRKAYGLEDSGTKKCGPKSNASLTLRFIRNKIFPECDEGPCRVTAWIDENGEENEESVCGGNGYVLPMLDTCMPGSVRYVSEKCQANWEW